MVAEQYVLLLPINVRFMRGYIELFHLSPYPCSRKNWLNIYPSPKLLFSMIKNVGNIGFRLK